MSEAVETVRSYLELFGDRSFDEAREFLVDSGFRYNSPIGDFEDADRFIENISRIGPIMQGLVIRKLFTSGNEAIAIVDISIAMQGFVTRTAVILFQIQESRIKSMEVIFDASEYYKMFERP
ncbi:MAG: hypothetical protein GY703_17965 [Gammaproteobacteria bacterium]|nr:hypothetical protein [Gammaproteobacteria bacterium]